MDICTTLDRSFQMASLVGFKSPEDPGDCPRVLRVTVDGVDKRYFLLTKSHPGVCDEQECQLAFENSPGQEMFHAAAPVYTHCMEHELCYFCIHTKYNPVVVADAQLTSHEQILLDKL